ncbi:hypothetical protein F5B22DRAFT_144064 [Xylaria bambusicola]|uniref:uncharacterized protein n=1 Tax=Xylaria bambusicola TaxID=326684 RepID=UPI0020077EFB|nr:uncharacterized protein F5B22DRAFT_144064 [Xylaria bambusicola]KAI0517032.1 hypothetical protein F5B22DRAFT_144064 [Xylaria bambusicola]
MGKDSGDFDTPLLESIWSDEQSTRRPSLPRRESFLKTSLFFLVHLIHFALLSYIAVLGTLYIRQPLCTPISDPPSSVASEYAKLLQMPLEFEERSAWLPLQAPWDQEPSPALDQAWADLMFGLNVRVTTDEVESLGFNRTNRLRVNGGDYFGVVGVYHQIHCLNSIRMMLHWDYYKIQFANFPESDELFTLAHTVHCIDTLRQWLMCHGGVEIHLVNWVDSPAERQLDGATSTTCLKWDSLAAWTRPRTLVPGTYTYRPGPLQESRQT